MAVRVPSELLERRPEVLAPAADLVYVAGDQPGLGRRRRGPGFSYHDEGGDLVEGSERQRIESLAIPPAWTEVWIAPDPRGHLQASGIDDAGRKQYLYHDEFRAYCDARKFDRLWYFGRAVVVIRKAVEHSLDRPVGTRDHAVAAAISLIDRCLLRVGNDESAGIGHHGATTLTSDHLIDDDATRLEYTAKGGKERTVDVDDDLVDVLVAMTDDADDRLFWFQDRPNGERRSVSALDVNDFIAAHAGPAFSAKDFRTWGASSLVLGARAAGADLLDAVDEAAERLGNTRGVARDSYVHPLVVDADGDTVDQLWRASRTSKWLDRSESALAKLLDPAAS